MVAQLGGGRRGAAVVDDDQGRRGERGDLDGLADAGGDDFRDDVGARETRREGEAERCGRSLKTFEILPERGADGALRTDEERDEDEVAFAGGELGGHPGLKRPRGGVAVERGQGDAVAVFPRDRMHRDADLEGELCGDDAEVERRGDLEGAVVDERYDHEANSVERAASNQASFSEESGDFTDDDNGGRAEAGVFGLKGDALKRGDHLAVFAGRCRLDDGDGSGADETAGLEASRDGLQVFHAHVEAERRAEFRVVFPVNRGAGLGGIFVAGEENDAAGMGAMGERDAGVGGGGESRSDPGHDLKRDAGGD